MQCLYIYLWIPTLLNMPCEKSSFEKRMEWIEDNCKALEREEESRQLDLDIAEMRRKRLARDPANTGGVRDLF